MNKEKFDAPNMHAHACTCCTFIFEAVRQQSVSNMSSLLSLLSHVLTRWCNMTP